MSRYKPGYTGPTTTAGSGRPRVTRPRQAPTMGPRPAPTMGPRQAPTMGPRQAPGMGPRMGGTISPTQIKPAPGGMKKGGKVKKVSSCSKRADGCAVKGKTKGRMV